MNKRQAKKKEKNKSLFYGMTYREDRLLLRELHEHEISQKHYKSLPDDIEILVELGIYTKEEVENRIYAKDKEKRRHRQINRVSIR